MRINHPVPRDGAETSYHVKLIHGYIAPSYEKWMGMAPMYPTTVPRIEDAAIFSRIGALSVADDTGGTPVMLTRTGKVRVIHP